MIGDDLVRIVIGVAETRLSVLSCFDAVGPVCRYKSCLDTAVEG